jgi:hypothetical protein
VRFDRDDESSVDRLSELPSGVEVIVGDRGNGWSSINEMYTETANASPECDWIWIMNDDVVVEGSDWDIKLSKAPHKSIVQPEIMGLGRSVYSRVEGAAFPLVPNQCWRDFGHSLIQEPADYWLDELLRVKNGWPTYWLEGIKVQHNRDDDDQLSRHRAL